MKKQILITTVIAWFGGFVLAPNDLISAFVYGGIAAFLCAVPLLILGRFAFVKTASKPVHTLICSLVCLIAILLLTCCMLTLSLRSRERFYRSMGASSASARVETTSYQARRGPGS
jgi:hypothetical protein